MSMCRSSVGCSSSSIACEDCAVVTSSSHNSAFRLGMDEWLVKDDAERDACSRSGCESRKHSLYICNDTTLLLLQMCAFGDYTCIRGRIESVHRTLQGVCV